MTRCYSCGTLLDKHGWCPNVYTGGGLTPRGKHAEGSMTERRERKPMTWEATCAACGWRYDGTRYKAALSWATQHRRQFALSSYSPLYTGEHKTTVRRKDEV
jgi:hypothetical protein